MMRNEAGAGKVKAGEAKTNEVRTDGEKTNEARTGKEKTDEARTGEAKAGEVKTEKGKTDKAKAGKAKADRRKEDRRAKNNRWENLQSFRYAHRGLFHQPKSASGKPELLLSPDAAGKAVRPSSAKPRTCCSQPLWKEDIRRWKEEGKKIIPENSMKAFRAAVRHGFGSELDVHLTKDGRLVVFHDTNLVRMTGVDCQIEQMTWPELSRLRLLDTTSPIPLLEEVLILYTSDKAAFRDRREDIALTLPLIIELKAEGNVQALCQSVMETIDRYPTLNYCIECFDPRVVFWFRLHRPDVIRGQLTENFMKSREAVRQWGHLLTFGMWSVAPDILSRPDFIASKFCDRRNVFIRLSHRLGVKQVNWIIRNQDDLDVVDREGGLGIFERFIPDREYHTHNRGQNSLR